MKAATPPCAWALATGVQGDGRLAARFRAEDLDDPAARQPPAAQGDVEAQAPVVMPWTSWRRALAQLHDGAFAELLLDLLQGVTQFLVLHGLRHDFLAVL